LNGRAVSVTATQTVSFPPGNGPELPNGEPATAVRLRLDETGALFSGEQRLDLANLPPAMRGKEALILIVPQSQPPIEVIEKSIRTLEQSGVRVYLAGPSYRYEDGRVIPLPGVAVPTQSLAEAAKRLGYAQYRWSLLKDGRTVISTRGLVPDTSEQAVMAAQLESWTITATYQLTLDAEGRITDVRPIRGSAIPELFEVLVGMVGKVFPGSSPSSNLELEIALR